MSTDDRHHAGGQIQGKRKRQEDDYGIRILATSDGPVELLAVADGMGGHAGGAEAAQAAIAAFLTAADAGTGTIKDRLNDGLVAANSAVAQLTEDKPDLDGAGCTLVAAAIEHDHLSWISVGDSSLLCLRNGELSRLNADHSMRPVLQDMVDAGRMTEEDLAQNPNRNALRSAVTGEDIELVDLQCDVRLRPGDQIVLASDGLDTLSPGQIRDILSDTRQNALDETVTALLTAVEDKDTRQQDNVTVILWRTNSPGAIPDTTVPTAQSPRKLWRRIALSAFVLIVVGLLAWLLMAHGGVQTLQSYLDGSANSHNSIQKPVKER